LPALWPSIDERKLSFLYIIAFVVFILILIHSLMND
jgi:preprotein translocase subunit SecE